MAQHRAAAQARGLAWPEVLWPAIAAEVISELSGLSLVAQESFLYHQIQTGHATRMTTEAANALRSLSERSVRLGIASNAQAYTLRELQEALREHGLTTDVFDDALGYWSFEHGFSKPDSHVFQILTTHLAARSIGPAQVLMVGDRLDNDIAPAKAHGWQTWHLGQKDAGWPGLRARLAQAQESLDSKGLPL